MSIVVRCLHSKKGIGSMVVGFPPELFRFAVVGGFTSLLGLALYEWLYAWNGSDEFREAWAWAVSYGLTSVLAHYLHHRLTFDPNRTYWKSLWRTLLVYGCAECSPQEAIMFMVQHMHHRVAWVLNMGSFGLLNFFLLRHYAYRDRGLQGRRGDFRA